MADSVALQWITAINAEERMDIIALSPEELRELQKAVAAQLTKMERAEREKAIERCYAIAHGVGLPLATLMAHGELKKKRAPHKGRQSYRDPANPNNTWSGSGPRPPWLKRAIDAGVRLDQLLS
jgi:DNA-binding protein H-NS